jgi:hypothetical protein
VPQSCDRLQSAVSICFDKSLGLELSYADQGVRGYAVSFIVVVFLGLNVMNKPIICSCLVPFEKVDEQIEVCLISCFEAHALGLDKLVELSDVVWHVDHF